MDKKTIDARGKLCPTPLIMTKKSLKGFDGELTVLLDNDSSFQNVKRFLSDNGKEFTEAEKDGLYSIFVNSDGNTADMSAAEDYCTIPVRVNAASKDAASYMIAFSSDRMGEGDDELGRLLIQGFCNSIKEADDLPSTLVFYNSGVLLTIEGSTVLPAIKALEENGVRLLVCGTCIDYYDVKDKLGAGIISNMYDIMDCLTKAERIVKP